MLLVVFTQVKNKIAYLSINWVKKLKYRRRVINKQHAKVSGLHNVPNLSYSAKGMFENYSVQIWDAMFQGLQHCGRKRVETSGVYFSSLKTFILSVKLENISIGTGGGGTRYIPGWGGAARPLISWPCLRQISLIFQPCLRQNSDFVIPCLRHLTRILINKRL